MIEAEQLHARILSRLDMTRDMEDEELTELIYEVLQEASQEEYLPLDQKTMLGKELFNAFRKLDLLQEFLEDEQITEIMINGTQNIFIEKAGRIIQSDKRFLSRDKLEDVIQQIVAGSNRLVNEASPIADGRRIESQCRTSAGRIKWADRYNSKICKRSNYNEKTDGMAVNQFRSIGFSGFISSRRIQYIHQWWNRIRENHFLECTIAIYTQK